MTLELRFGQNELYENGALLLTAIVCSEKSDEARSSELFHSLCARALRLKYLANLDDVTPITAKPQYIFRDLGTVARDVTFAGKRFGVRMVAGRMAVPFFQHACQGAPVRLPTEIKRLSVNQLAEYVMDDAGQADSANVKKRVWNPSRPVIHLCAAAAIIARGIRKAGGSVHMESFLFDRDLIKAVVECAEELAQFAEKDAKFPVPAARLLRVRLA